MFARLLSFLFPPRLPGRLYDWPEPEPLRYFTEEQGWAGNTRRLYTGIEKHAMQYGGTYRQYLTQLRNAEKQMAAIENELIAQGYTNTIHDCWEKIEPEPSLGELQKLTLQGPPKRA